MGDCFWRNSLVLGKNLFEIMRIFFQCYFVICDKVSSEVLGGVSPCLFNRFLQQNKNFKKSSEIKRNLSGLGVLLPASSNLCCFDWSSNLLLKRKRKIMRNQKKDLKKEKMRNLHVVW